MRRKGKTAAESRFGWDHRELLKWLQIKTYCVVAGLVLSCNQ
jgi:hypothetical protein